MNDKAEDHYPHLHPTSAHKAACPMCNPTNTVPELNQAYASLTSNPVSLPTWEECKAKVDADTATALEAFIYENEPALTEKAQDFVRKCIPNYSRRADEQFRGMLSDLIAFVRARVETSEPLSQLSDLVHDFGGYVPGDHVLRLAERAGVKVDPETWNIVRKRAGLPEEPTPSRIMGDIAHRAAALLPDRSEGGEGPTLEINLRLEKASERECSWGCHYVEGRLVRNTACTLHGASSSENGGAPR